MKKSLLIRNCQSFNSQKVSDKAEKTSVFCHLFNLRFLTVFLVSAIFVSNLCYIFQVNRLATMGREIGKKQQIIDELKDKNETLEIKVAQLKSGYYFESEKERLNLINPEEISFVELEDDGSVAMIQ